MKNNTFKISNIHYTCDSFDDYSFLFNVNSLSFSLYSTTFLDQSSCVSYVKSLFSSSSTIFKVIYYFQVNKHGKTFYSKRIHTFFSFSSVYKFISDTYFKHNSFTTSSFLIYPSSPDFSICNPYLRA